MATNKIVQQSRENAMKEKYLEKNRILKIEDTKDKLRMCSCCGMIQNESKHHEVKIGHHGQSITFVLCKECLSKLGDLIWRIL